MIFSQYFSFPLELIIIYKWKSITSISINLFNYSVYSPA